MFHWQQVDKLSHFHQSQAMNVVCGLILSNKKILIAKRPAHKHHGGLWEFPGGKVENNESLKEALVRELKEEMDIFVSTDSMKKVGQVETDKIKLHLITFNLSSHFIPFEHSAVAWTDFEGLKKMNLCPSDRLALQQLSEKFSALFLGDS